MIVSYKKTDIAAVLKRSPSIESIMLEQTIWNFDSFFDPNVSSLDKKRNKSTDMFIIIY